MRNEASEVFDPEPTAVSRARGFARDTLDAWGVPAAEDGILLVSELVTNVVQHAGTRARVTLRLEEGTLEVGVADWHPSRVVPVPPDRIDERGRGLLLPTALAQTWGVTYTPVTKTVWFRLAAGSAALLPAPVPAPSPAHDELEVRAPAGSRIQLGLMDFAELIRHTLEAARDAVGADASYVLIADEEGELRVRGATGIAQPAALTAAPPSVVLASGASARATLAVPFVIDGRVVGVLGAGAAEPDRFADDERSGLQEVADRVAMALERLRLSELERVRRGRVAFLAEASEMLSTTLDQTRASALAAQLVVPRLATWCAVYLDGQGVSYVWHADESRGDALTELLAAIPPPDVSGGRSWSLAVGPDAGLSPQALLLSRDSAWCFPLTARGRALGVVVLGRTRGDPRWPDPPSHQTFELAEDLTRRVALALDNARLYERQRETSQALQRSLLPPELPSIPRVDLAAMHEAAGEINEVGGDFYDVFPVEVFGAGGLIAEGEQRWRFAIGDVCGTGPEAAAVTGLARHTLRILSGEGRTIPDVMSRLNELIGRTVPKDRFVTLLHGEIVVPPSGPLRVSVISAGHPLPLLLRASGATEVAEVAEPQALLGVMENCTYDVQEFEMFPSDILLCVTDGITERRDDTGALLDDHAGLARIFEGCRAMPAAAVVARVRRAVEDFGSDSPTDDMAILTIRAKPGRPS